MRIGFETDELVHQRLRENGVRLTAPRRAVIRALAAGEQALTVQELLAAARSHYSPLGQATVYRTMELLQRLGLARRIHHESRGCQRYFLALPGHWHQLICLECGRIVEFPGGNDLEWLKQELNAETGFQIEGHLLQFYGRCPEHLNA